MRQFSFTSFSRSQHRAIARWITVSIVLIGGCGAILLCVSAPEYFVYEKLTTHYAELKQATSARTPAKIDPHAQLAVTKIESRKKKSHHTCTFLKQVRSLCSADCSLESLLIKHDDIQLTLAAPHTHTLVALADSLNQNSLCMGMHISCLEPKEQRMVATLKTHQQIKNS